MRALLFFKYLGQSLTVDPAGCACTPCVLWESVPADQLTELQKSQVVDDYKVDDRTGYTEYEWEKYLV